MFSKRHRLKKDAFPAALSRGVRVSSPNFGAILLKDTEGVAVVISKKTIKGAVGRHRAKRRVLAALKCLPSLPKGVVIFPKASVISMPFADLSQELEKLLSNTPLKP